MDIAGKTVLVTGAGRGLGRTLAFACANAGALKVFAGARSSEHLEQLKRDGTTAGLPIVPIRLDVSSDTDVRAAAQICPADVLINNAGVAGYGNPLTMSFDDILNELEVNYLGVLRMVRAFAPAMIKQRSGMIVNIATVFAKVNLPLVGTYCATKAALLSLGQALRAYLQESGVSVITVMPTTIDTDMSSGADVPKMTKEFVANEILRHIREETIDPPIGKEAEEIYRQLLKDPLAVEKGLALFRA